MSYILEALKKSEQERRLGHVPDISVLQEAPARAPQRWQRWLLAALLLNLLVLLIVAWRPWVRPIAPAPDVAQPSMATPEPAEAVTQAPAMEEAASLPPPVSSTPIGPAPVVSAAPPAAVPEPIATEPVGSLPPEAPRWQDLPVDQRNSLPVPRIDVHVFAQEPARRFVLIELRKYHEGDRLDGGATIDSIRNDGIVLSYQGQRYRVDRP